MAWPDGAARTVVEHALIHGSPAMVAEKLAAIDAIGVGGLIMSFRLGPMSHDLATQPQVVRQN